MPKLALLALLAGALAAQNIFEPRVNAAAPVPILKQVGIDQRLNASVPAALEFRDETGNAVALRAYLGRKPVVLAPVYYGCPRLCTEIMTGLASSLKAVGFRPGREFDVVAFSFDPKDTPEHAAAKKQKFLQRYGRPETAPGWHFLTGDPSAIRALTEAIGYRYAFDGKSQQFAHASAILILTPQGKISRYLYGVEYAPRDIRLALIEASQEKIGNLLDRAMLFCYHYDPADGRYTSAVLRSLRGAAALTLLSLGAFWIAMFRRERRRELH